MPLPHAHNEGLVLGFGPVSRSGSKEEDENERFCTPPALLSATLTRGGSMKDSEEVRSQGRNEDDASRHSGQSPILQEGSTRSSIVSVLEDGLSRPATYDHAEGLTNNPSNESVTAVSAISVQVPMDARLSHIALQLKRRRLPEVPRLRNKFRDQSVICGGLWEHEAVTVKRFHHKLAERLNLSDQDWDPSRTYEFCADDLENAAVKKMEREREEAVMKLQRTWREATVYNTTHQLIVARREAFLRIQRWWRVIVRLRLLVLRRIRRKPILHQAATKLQALARRWLTRRKYANALEIHSVGWQMQILKEHLMLEEVRSACHLQRCARGFLVRRRLKKKKELAKALTKVAISPDQLDTPAGVLKGRRMSVNENSAQRRRMSLLTRPGHRRNSISMQCQVFVAQARRPSEASASSGILTPNSNTSSATTGTGGMATLGLPTLRHYQHRHSLRQQSLILETSIPLRMAGASQPEVVALSAAALAEAISPISWRATTSTPLAVRMKRIRKKRTLNSSIARMGGLRPALHRMKDTEDHGSSFGSTPSSTDSSGEEEEEEEEEEE